MIINSGTLRTLFIGFSAAFQGAYTSVVPKWNQVAMRIPSTTAANEYGWLSGMPQIREWIGERHIKQLALDAYTLANRDWETTWSVKRKDIERDNVGGYTMMFQQAGQDAALFPDREVFKLLKNGFTTTCYDNQFFFDSDHPIIDENDAVGTFSNTGGGSGTNWFLLDVGQVMKPLIFQEEKPFNLVRKDREEDDNTFMRGEYVYGLDGRMAFGYGIPQFAFGSKQTLDKTNYSNAREALMGMKRNGGVPIDTRRHLLVVPPSLEGEAKELLEAERNAAGATNIYRGTADLLVTNYVA